jgi:hypothetical protein
VLSDALSRHGGALFAGMALTEREVAGLSRMARPILRAVLEAGVHDQSERVMCHPR